MQNVSPLPSPDLIAASTIQSLLLARQASSFSLILNSDRTYSFDPSGRPVSLVIGGRYFSRSLGGEMKEKSWKGALSLFDRIIENVSSSEKTTLMKILYDDIRLARASVEGRALTPQIHDAVSPSLALDEIVSFLIGLEHRLLHLGKEERQFRTLYKPISILPPDHYFTIVLQVTEGCAWNRCVFCDFYRDRAFRVRPFGELVDHFKKVTDFLGKGIHLRNSIFLADANAFVMKRESLLPILREIQQRFPEQALPPGQGISSFADVRAVLSKGQDELAVLRSAGLRRLYIGMETGSDDLRQAIKKPGTAADLQRAVRALKQNDIAVGLIVMLGLGGQEKEAEHINETRATLQSLTLDPDDIVFFSPYHPKPHSEYAAVARDRKWTPLQKKDLENQFLAIRDPLRNNLRVRARMGVYDIREFIY